MPENRGFPHFYQLIFNHFIFNLLDNDTLQEITL